MIITLKCGLYRSTFTRAAIGLRLQIFMKTPTLPLRPTCSPAITVLIWLNILMYDGTYCSVRKFHTRNVFKLYFSKTEKIKPYLRTYSAFQSTLNCKVLFNYYS